MKRSRSNTPRFPSFRHQMYPDLGPIIKDDRLAYSFLERREALCLMTPCTSDQENMLQYLKSLHEVIMIRKDYVQ